jgi:hypothetical protein
VFDDPAVGDPPDVDVPDRELPARRLAAHERAGVASAHDHALNDLVAGSDLVLDLEPKIAEGAVEALHRLLDALRARWVLRVSRLVVLEVRVDELVRESEIALRVDLLESATDQPLVLFRRGGH